MTDKTWHWANLNREQLERIQEAEQSLSVDYLLAFHTVEKETNGENIVSPQNVQFAQLTESQLECLQGLEAQLETTLVAYQIPQARGAR